LCPESMYNQSFPFEGEWKCSLCRGSCDLGTSFISQECSANQDTACQTCKTECPSGKYITANCTDIKDITCKSCAFGCSVGSYMSTPCTKYANMICSPCTLACPSSRYAVVSVCTFGKDLTCVLCPLGSYADKTKNVCVKCFPGYIALMEGCVKCPPDNILSDYTRTQCVKQCLPGTYPATSNSCDICPPSTGGDGTGCISSILLENMHDNQTNKVCTPKFIINKS
jgi:hypothetical protein